MKKVLCSVFMLLIIVSSMVGCSNTAKTKSAYEVTEVETESNTETERNVFHWKRY